MSRSTQLMISIPLLLTAAFLVSLNGCTAVRSSGAPIGAAVLPASSKIQHVVIIFQENRTPDNLFQDPVLIARGADIQNYGVNSKGQKIYLSEIDLGTNGSDPDHYGLDHTHNGFLHLCRKNKGRCVMDGADLVGAGCDAAFPACLPPNPQFKYVKSADVQPYFEMAEQYTFADRMFQTNQGPSFPAHQFIISGTSAPSPTSNLFAAENPANVNRTGCIAAPGAVVPMIDPDGLESSEQYPCFDHATLTDYLEAKWVSWRYSTSAGAGSIWTGPNAIQHMCGPDLPPPDAMACTGDNWVNHVVLTGTLNPVPVLSDIANGQLPAVSWVIPNGQESDHPSGTDGSGPSWVAAIVNAIGNSQYWSNTVIFITWDDWGGWYDHVAPPLVNDGVSWGSGYVYGFRVPLIVVSPYAKAANISHVQHDFGSILKFIETDFGLPSLGYADAPADDLSDCFNFNQTPIQFRTIAAPLQADHFLNDKRPPTDPDDD
jgi:phospholipase C